MNSATLRIYDHLLHGILQGKAGQDGRLPTESDLAAQFGASRMSAHAAMKELERHGIIASRRGSGTVIRKSPSPTLARYLKGIAARRVHVVAELEQVPLHWTESTLRELEAILGADGYSVSHVTIPPELTRETLSDLLKEITSQGSSALVLILPARVSKLFLKHADLIFQYHRHVLLLNRGDTPPEGWPFYVVSVDPFAEGVLAAEYLYEKGYRRFAFWYARSEAAYWAGQRAAGLTMGLQRASEGALSPEIWRGTAEEVSARLRSGADPLAVVTASDESASWLIDAAAEQHLCAPRDFGLVGFDNNPRFRQYNITTIAPPLDSIGRMIARVVSGRLLPLEEFSSLSLRVPSRLVERGTCADVPGADREVGPGDRVL